MSGYSQMPLLLLRARCQEEAEEAQTSFLPDGVGSSLTLDLDLDLGKGQGKGVHEQVQVQVQGAGLAKRGGLFRNCIYMKQPNMKRYSLTAAGLGPGGGGGGGGALGGAGGSR